MRAVWRVYQLSCCSKSLIRVECKQMSLRSPGLHRKQTPNRLMWTCIFEQQSSYWLRSRNDEWHITKVKEAEQTAQSLEWSEYTFKCSQRGREASFLVHLNQLQNAFTAPILKCRWRILVQIDCQSTTSLYCNQALVADNRTEKDGLNLITNGDVLKPIWQLEWPTRLKVVQPECVGK